jgi:hypothetical protein
MARERSSSGNFPSGGHYRWSFNGVVYTDTSDRAETYQSRLDYCLDENQSPGLDHPLQITHRRNDVVPLNGTYGDPWWGWHEWLGFYSPAMTIGQPSHLAVPMPSIEVSATQALARSNPNKPAVSLPNFIFELKDLPKMLKEVGHFKLGRFAGKGGGKYAASQYLGATMGWRPLLSDIRKMIQFQDIVTKKYNELERLHSKGGLRRSVKLTNGDQSATSLETNHLIESSGAVLYCSIATTTTVKRWATVRWLPDLALMAKLNVSSTPSMKLARSLAFGMHLQPEMIWDAIPWSWFEDWFYNAGDFLGAYANTVPVTHGVVNVMTTTETKQEWTRTDGVTSIKGGYGTKSLISKTRNQQLAASFQASIPLLGSGQLSTLAALAVQRKS